MYDRRTVLRMTGVAVAGSVAGCGGEESPTDADGNPRVTMTAELNFEPERVSVAVDDTVVWENPATVDHSVTAYEGELPEGATYFASGGFDSEADARDAYRTGAVEQGETFSHTFETAGEFPYFCIPHESGMRGTIVVE